MDHSYHYHWVGPLFAIRVSCLQLSIIGTFTSCLPRQHDRKLWVVLCNTLSERFCWPIFFIIFENKSWIKWWSALVLVHEEPGVGPMQDAWKHLCLWTINMFFVCVSMLFLHATLITHFCFIPKSKCPPFYSLTTLLYECILPTFHIFNSLKNNKWIKFSKTWKILWLPITTLIAHSKMENFHLLSKFQFFLPKYFFNILTKLQAFCAKHGCQFW